MSELSTVADAMGVPESLVQRAAEARASAAGTSIEEVLEAWAGGGSAMASTPPSVEESPAAERSELAPAPEPSEALLELEPASAAQEPVAATAAAATPTTRAPVPREVTMVEAAKLREVITVPTVGIRERTNFIIPRWLSAVMLIIPVFALFVLGNSATGHCGEAIELRADVVTGQIVNCDGSEFTGFSVGGGVTDFVALGERIYNGEGATCAGCHLPDGSGAAGPALGGVLTTFGACPDHIEWVRLGTDGFSAEGRATYGDTNKPVGGAGKMPPHESLSDEQLASVAAFERIRFGGGSPDQVLTDCGLAEEPVEEGAEESEEPPAGDQTGG